MQIVRRTLSTSFDLPEQPKNAFRYISFVTKLRTELQSLFRQVSPRGSGGRVIVKTATLRQHARRPITLIRQSASSVCHIDMIARKECLSCLRFRGFSVLGPCRWLKPGRSGHLIDFTRHWVCRCNRPSPYSADPGRLVPSRSSSSGFPARSLSRARVRSTNRPSCGQACHPNLFCTSASGHGPGR